MNGQVSFLPFFTFITVFSLAACIVLSDVELVASEFVSIFCGVLVLGKAGWMKLLVL